MFYEIRVPGGSQAQRNGQHGPEAVNHIPGQQERDTQTAFLRGDSLQLVRDVYIHHIEQRAYPAGLDGGAQVRGDSARIVDLDHLTDLFLQAHLLDDLNNSRLDRVIGRKCFYSHGTRRCVHTMDPKEEARGKSARRVTCKVVSAHR